MTLFIFPEEPYDQRIFIAGVAEVHRTPSFPFPSLRRIRFHPNRAAASSFHLIKRLLVNSTVRSEGRPCNDGYGHDVTSDSKVMSNCRRLL